MVIFKIYKFKQVFHNRLLGVFHWQFLITYIFSLFLKFGACYITSQWGRVQSKQCYFIFTYTFLECFSCILSKKFVFLSFLFLFFFLWWSNKFPQQIINQSETRSGDKKSSLSKHCNHFYLIICFRDQLSHFYSIGHFVS